MISAKTFIALGLGAGACVGWWWVTRQQAHDVGRQLEPGREEKAEAGVHGSHRISTEPVQRHAPQPASIPPGPVAPAQTEDLQAPIITKVRSPAPARQAPPIPSQSTTASVTAAQSKGVPEEGLETAGQKAAPSGAARRKGLVAAAAKRKEQAAKEQTEPTPEPKQMLETIPQYTVAPPPKPRPTVATAETATAEWAALHAEGWRRAAALDEWKKRVPSEDKFISCRAARASTVQRAKDPGGKVDDAANDDSIDLENGVWCLEDEDRYSGAGGREMSEEEMKQVIEQDKVISEFWRNKYEEDARRCWDVFYHVNKTNFFKDRHYLDREWPELQQAHLAVLDLGCGVGNTTLPLLQLNSTLKLWSCDFSPNAVQLMKESAGFDGSRCSAFVNDMTQDALTDHVGAESIDVCMLIFVLSAINPDKMVHSLQNMGRVMKPGGRVLLRDYGVYDMAEIRMAEQKGHKISDNFYVRKDGTRAFYFSQEVLQRIFEEAGFEAQDLRMHKRVVRNRKQHADMHRRWIQGIFVKSPNTVSL